MTRDAPERRGRSSSRPWSSTRPEARAAYLDRACGGDAELRRRVEALLDAHDRGGRASSSRPALDADRRPVDQPPAAEGPGTVIGPYKLLEQIGEGGMGVVFMAEQTQPVRRKVALKVIKPGMDTRQVIARFEAERQALALMDHPNIAKVLDAGATDVGPPLLRHGAGPRHPDHRVLRPASGSPSASGWSCSSLVCQAVQHAHQKGIIHRDLKPSNVLVTLHDGVPVPKVIDFGVAKAIGQQLTEQDAAHRLRTSSSARRCT